MVAKVSANITSRNGTNLDNIPRRVYGTTAEEYDSEKETVDDPDSVFARLERLKKERKRARASQGN